MKYLKLFENHSQYVGCVLGGTMMKPNVSHCINENEVHYNPLKWSSEYFTIESLEDDNTIYLKASDSAITKTVSASTDNGKTWAEYVSSIGDNGTTLATLNKGDKLLVKGENSTYSTSDARYNQFKTTGRFEAKGNIMALANGDSFANADELTATYTFNHLFYQCTGLTSVENLILPATTLADLCYEYMFAGCTSLTTAPALPATNLANADYCYESMFAGCTSLTTAPELPATTLGHLSYYNMFRDCTNLNYIKCLATNIPVSNYSTNGWVSGVAATGTFIKAPSMNNWTTGNSGIPSGWTVQDATE